MEESAPAHSVCIGVMLFLTLVSVFSELLRHRKTWWKQLRAIWKKINAKDEGYIHERICIKKTMLARKLVWYVLLMTSLSLISYLVGYEAYWTILGCWILLIRASIFLAICQVARRLSPGKLNLMYLVYQITAAIEVTPWSVATANLTVVLFRGFALFSLPVCTCATNPMVVFAGQAGILLVVVVRCLGELHSETSSPSGRSTQEQIGPVFVVWNAAFVVFSLVVSCLTTHLIRQKVELEIRDQDNASQLSAASSLLNLTCDAVVELNEEMKLMSPSQKLSTMLLGRAGATLEGSKFTDFVASGEAERAAEILTTSDNVNGAHAFHTHLVDSCCSKFRTEVFQVRYRMANGKQCHLLGLREFTDLKSLAGGNATDALSDVDGARPPSSQRGPSTKASSWFSLTSHPGILKKKHSKDAFLVLDLDEHVVSCATAPFSQLTGLGLAEVFSSEVMDELLCFHRKAKSFTISRVDEVEMTPIQEFLPDETASFMRMTLSVASHVLEIKGVMKVGLSRVGKFQVIVCCTVLSCGQARKPVKKALPL